MSTAIVVVAVAAVYIALGVVSSALAYAPADAWTVWLASGPVLGLLLACRRGGARPFWAGRRSAPRRSAC